MDETPAVPDHERDRPRTDLGGFERDRELAEPELEATLARVDEPFGSSDVDDADADAAAGEVSARTTGRRERPRPTSTPLRRRRGRARGSIDVGSCRPGSATDVQARVKRR
jgi:hypothetical protein